MTWTKKHQPKNESEIEAQEEAVKTIRNFVVNFKNSRKKALILHGPVGSGKTCSVYAIANNLDYEVLEVNASDVRNKEAINSVIGSASKQMPLFCQGKIILVDDIDGIAGKNDFGGIAALVKLINETGFPIIMTSNNPYDKKFSSLRNKSMLVEFYELDSASIFNVLKRIAQKENIAHDSFALKALANRSGGDLRAAINDLQTLSSEKKLTKEFVDEISQREKQETIINALMKILKTTDPATAVSAFDNVQEDLDHRFLWLDENLPKEYRRPKDLQRAYEALSKADIFRGRIRRWQYWRFLVYINSLLTAGVSVSKDEKYKAFTKYSPTKRLLKLWQAKMKYQKRKAIAEKIALKNHCSAKRAMKETFPYVQAIFKSRDKQMKQELQNFLELDDMEVGWLKK